MKGDIKELEKWNRVYKILFPNDDPNDMPTACMYTRVKVTPVENTANRQQITR